MFRIALIAASFFASFSVHSILTQSNIPKEKYSAFADHSQFNSVGELSLALNGGEHGTCTGTVVDPRTIMTAAHCLHGLSLATISRVDVDRIIGFISFSKKRSNLDDSAERYYIINARVFPSCLHNQASKHRAKTQYQVAEDCDEDIALLYLDRPFHLPEYLSVYAPNNPHQFVASAVQITGYGQNGDESSMNLREATEKLAAQMVIDRVVEFSPGKWKLLAKFLTGDEESLMGAPSAGDSGGPVMRILPDGKPHIIGIVKETFIYDLPLITFNGSDYANPFTTTGIRYTGQGMDRGFIFTGSYSDFIYKGMATKYMRSMEIADRAQLWSETDMWMQPLGQSFRDHVVSNRQWFDHGGISSWFFQTEIASHVFMDVDVTVDTMRLSTNTAFLEIPKERHVTSYFIDGAAGFFRIDGELATENFVVHGGCELSGLGTIYLYKPPYVKRLDPRSIRTLLVLDGTINLAKKSFTTASDTNSYERLRIEGGYHHGNDAVLKVSLGMFSEASLLSVRDNIHIDGGTLILDVDPLVSTVVDFMVLDDNLLFNTTVFNLHKEKRWTILKSEKQLSGAFRNVIFRNLHDFKSNVNFSIQYFPDHVDVVMREF